MGLRGRDRRKKEREKKSNEKERIKNKERSVLEKDLSYPHPPSIKEKEIIFF